MQEKKWVYIVSKNDSNYKFSLKTSWRELFGNLQGMPIQESTYLEYKNRFLTFTTYLSPEMLIQKLMGL